MLCTSGFTDDVTFAVTGRMAMRGDTGAESDVYECSVYLCHDNGISFTITNSETVQHAD